jgi:hypothetical protein
MTHDRARTSKKELFLLRRLKVDNNNDVSAESATRKLERAAVLDRPRIAFIHLYE